ncbi:hypothetical protein HDU97_008848 [Phlyctochytrium planicorne]|nr:hypothetical protein HDU97_008848 [Phlyctochytrium planicorne]
MVSRAKYTLVVLEEETFEKEKELLNLLSEVDIEAIPVLSTDGSGRHPRFVKVVSAIAEFFQDSWFWKGETAADAILSVKLTAVTPTAKVLEKELDEWFNIGKSIQRKSSRFLSGPIQQYKSSKDFWGVVALAKLRQDRCTDWRHVITTDECKTEPFYQITQVYQVLRQREFRRQSDLYKALSIICYGIGSSADFSDSLATASRHGIAQKDISILAFKHRSSMSRDQDTSLSWLGDTVSSGVPTEYNGRLIPLSDIQRAAQTPKVNRTFLSSIFKHKPPLSEGDSSMALEPIRNAVNLPEPTVLVMSEDGALSVTAAVIGHISWVSNLGRSNELPEDFMELCSQIVWGARLTNANLRDWLLGIAPSRNPRLQAATEIVASMIMKRDYTVVDGELVHEELFTLFEEDRRKGGGLWEIANAVQQMLDVYAKKWGNSVGRGGRVALMTASDGSGQHVCILDRDVPLRSLVIAYGAVERGDAGHGVLTLICDVAKGGNSLIVLGTSTPLHSLSHKTLKLDVFDFN